MSIDLSTYGGRLRDVGYAGELVDQNPVISESKLNEGATAIDFGVAVARGAADNTCKAPAVDGDAIIGLSMRHAIKASPGYGQMNAGVINYSQYDEVPVLREGYMFAVAFENATRGDGVISVTAQNGKLGSTTGGAVGAGRVAVPGATWETTVAAGAIGIVKINN
jgi:hypothetical protein